MKIIEPLSIEAEDATNTLFIAWSDGHTTQHAIGHLRWLCPCAECKGEWGRPGMLSQVRELSPQQTMLTDVRPVGRYALAPIWADGHDTGFYPYEYLRKNCECPACVAARAKEES